MAARGCGTMPHVAWTEAETTRLVESYYAAWELGHSDEPVPRELRDRHWWAVERLQEEVDEGTLPLSVLDALLKAPGSDEYWRSYVAAGPLEDLLEYHGGRYGGPIAEKCRADPLWAEAAGGVWLRREGWEALPETLQRLVPEPQRQLSKARKTRKSPSKRQQRRPRG